MYISIGKLWRRQYEKQIEEKRLSHKKKSTGILTHPVIATDNQGEYHHLPVEFHSSCSFCPVNQFQRIFHVS
jgi:hypothetical protein